MKLARVSFLLGTTLLVASAARAAEWDRHGGGRHESNYSGHPSSEHGSHSVPSFTSHSEAPQAPNAAGGGHPAHWSENSGRRFHADETPTNAPNRFETGNPDNRHAHDARSFPHDITDEHDFPRSHHDHNADGPSANDQRSNHFMHDAGRPPGGNFVYPREHVHHFSGHDFANFDRHERDLWRGGRWNHGWHHHRYGWWWFTGGLWYFYDTPLYPYPDYVSNDYYEDDQSYYGNGYGDGGDNGNYWYYCRDPEGYYPYVRQCNGDWEAVPAQPYGSQDSYDQGPQQDDEYDDQENDDDDGY